VSFLPVFALEAQEGRLFASAGLDQDLRHGRWPHFLSVTLVPVLMLLFVRGKILPGSAKPGQSHC
jgi:Cu(I)/Ag(I) efflux system membrane protein CusA/SilA